MATWPACGMRGTVGAGSPPTIWPDPIRWCGFAARITSSRSALLVAAAGDPKRREQLHRYYRGSGPGFDGGTVADLVNHVLANNLSVRTGSPAHVIFAELGHDMLRDLNGQVDLADQRVEYYKIQNSDAELDPNLYGAQLPQRQQTPGPGALTTSVERLRQLQAADPNPPGARKATVDQQVMWRK